MATSTQCFTPVRGKRIRVTSLNECGGVPAVGTPNSMAVTDGFVTVKLSAEVEEGVKIFSRKANGDVCVNERFASTFKDFTVEIQFCGVDPGLLAMLTNAEGYLDYAKNLSGIVVPEGTIDKKFSLELWTGLSGQACEPGVEEASGYMLLPFVNGGTLADIEVGGDKEVSFTMTGGYSKGGNGWGVGPYNVLGNNGTPSPLPTALDPLDHLLLIGTTIAPPPAACGLQTFDPTASVAATPTTGTSTTTTTTGTTTTTTGTGTTTTDPGDGTTVPVNTTVN